jgi:phage terminase large subunit-like protein
MITEFVAKFRVTNGITYLEKMIDGTSKKVILDTYDGLDPASGRNDRTDDTSKITIGRMPDGKWIVLDVYVGIIEFEEQCTVQYDSIKRYAPRVAMIESVAYQYSLYSVIKKECRRRKYSTLIKDFNTSKSKNNKFKESLTVLVNQGNLYYIKGCRNIEILIRELSNFNREDDKDDTVDALYLGVIACKDRIPKAVDVNKLIRTKTQATDIYSRAIREIQKGKHIPWHKQFQESM